MLREINRTADQQRRRDRRAASLRRTRLLMKWEDTPAWPTMGKRKRPAVFIVEYGVEDHEEGGVRTGRREYDRAAFVLEMKDQDWFDPSDEQYADHKWWEDINNVRTLLSDVYENGDCCGCHVFTEIEQRKHEAQQEEARLEDVAAAFAGSCGHKIGTVGFLKALIRATRRERDRREQYDSGESRMEEWAAHLHAGCTEHYFENREFTRGRMSSRIEDLRAVRNWLERKCPLLMAKYAERKLRRRG